MSSIIELRKKELTTQINQMVGSIQYFFDNKKLNTSSISISQYLQYNTDKLNTAKDDLQRIKNKFNPQSDNFESFENCINELKDIQSEINNVQTKGENKLNNLQYLLPIKILLSVIFSIIYIWIWIVYWRWVEGWRYITLIVTVWYLPCYPLLLILYYMGDSTDESFWAQYFRNFFTGLLLKD